MIIYAHHIKDGERVLFLSIGDGFDNISGSS